MTADPNHPGMPMVMYAVGCRTASERADFHKRFWSEVAARAAAGEQAHVFDVEALSALRAKK